MKLVVFLFAVFTVVTAQAQGGWTKSKGEGYYQISYTGFASDQYYNLDGELLTTNEFAQSSVVVYGEYGLGSNIALVTNFVGFRWNGFESTETVSGIGDLYLAIQYALKKGKLPISLTLGPEIPTGRSELFAQSKTISFEKINLPTGDGEWNVRAFLAASYPFQKLPIYISSHVTWNFRTTYDNTKLSDQYGAGFEVGYNPIKPLWLIAKTGILGSPGTPASGVDFVRGEGTSFGSTDFVASYKLWNNFSIMTGVRFFNDFIVQKANMYDGTNYTFGIAYQLQKSELPE